MPIDPGELIYENDGLLLLDGARTIAEAAEALAAQGGADWWTLVVRHEGGYSKGTFGDLRRALEADPTALHRPLAEIDGLTPVEAVQQDSMSTDAAWDRAYETDAEALVVLHGDAFLGLLAETTRAAADAFATVSLIRLVEQAGGSATKLPADDRDG
ncbi:MAG: hypothetical protein Kow00120_01920 [Anaerolineae bacterium]